MFEKKRKPISQSKNPLKKSKFLSSSDTMRDTPTVDDPDTIYSNLLSKLHLENGNKVKDIYIKLIENRCSKGDNLKEIAPDRAIICYLESLKLFKDWQTGNGLKIDSIDNTVIESLSEEDIKQKATIYYNLYALYSIEKGSTDTLKALDKLNLAIFYFEKLTQINPDLYKDELLECQTEKRIWEPILDDTVELIKEVETEIEIESEVEIEEATEDNIEGMKIYAHSIAEKTNPLYQFPHASLVFNAIAASQNEHLIFNDAQQAYEVAGWLLNETTLQRMHALIGIKLDINTITVTDAQSLFHLKQWQQTNSYILDNLKNKNWLNIFKKIFHQKSNQDRLISCKKVPKILHSYYEKLLPCISLADKADFESAYKQVCKANEKRQRKARKIKERKAEKAKNKKDQDSTKQNLPIEKEIPPKSSAINLPPINNSSTFFQFNFNPAPSKPLVLRLVHQDKSSTENSTSSMQTIGVHGQKPTTTEVIPNTFQIKPTRDVDRYKSELTKKSIPELLKMREEMTTKVQQKLSEECSTIIKEIRNLEKELNKEQDKNITLSDVLDIEGLKKKRESFQKVLQALTAEMQNEKKRCVMQIQTIWQHIKQFSIILKLSESEIPKTKNLTEMKTLIELKEESKKLTEQYNELEKRCKLNLVNALILLEAEFESTSDLVKSSNLMSIS